MDGWMDTTWQSDQRAIQHHTGGIRHRKQLGAVLEWRWWHCSGCRLPWPSQTSGCSGWRWLGSGTQYLWNTEEIFYIMSKKTFFWILSMTSMSMMRQWAWLRLNQLICCKYTSLYPTKHKYSRIVCRKSLKNLQFDAKLVCRSLNFFLWDKTSSN